MENRKRKNIWKQICTFLLALVLLGMGDGLGTREVLAGASVNVIDNTSFSEKLDTTKWHNPNGDVVVEHGKLVFSEESNGDTRLITRQPMKGSEYETKLFQADYGLRLKKIPAGEKVVFAFALKSIESYYEEAGNLEIVFTNENGLKVQIDAYGEEGNAISLLSSRNIGASLGSAINIGVSANTDNQLKITVNGKTLYNAISPVSLEGRAGILQSGNCAVELSSVNLVSYTYDAPENTNIVEDFESGSINVNALTSQMLSSNNYYPSAVQVEDYNGNKVLRFRNSGNAYFGTMHPYSNFELTFDIPYYQFSAKLREDGTLQSPACGNIILTMGGEAADYTKVGYSSAAASIVFRANQIYNLKNNADVVKLQNTPYINREKNEGYSVKVTVIDAVVTVYLKALHASVYEEVLSYSTGTVTPLGYVHIWTNGSGNFAIDNFTITNKDIIPQVKEVEYKAAVIEGTEDWEYEPMNTVYLTSEENKEKGLSPWMPITAANVLAVLILSGCVLVRTIRKTPRKKEDKSDES